MRFDRLELHRFGHFEELAIGFGEAPLHVIYGRNEAGKTTLLAALRDVLFGVPPRSPYGYKFGNPAIELRAEVTMSDAQRGRMELSGGSLDDMLSAYWNNQQGDVPVHTWAP